MAGRRPKEMTEDEERFAEEFAIDGDYARAWEAVFGPSEKSYKNGHHLSRRSAVATRIRELSGRVDPPAKEVIAKIVGHDADKNRAIVKQAVAHAARHLRIDAKRVMDELVKNIELARKGGDIRAANQCLKLLGQEIGMFHPPPKEEKPPAGDIHNHLHLTASQGADWSDVKALVFDGEATKIEDHA